eukprot:CAMPEP_0119483798 /NCGR_PEP_ID=MMETSP1344-20130328/11047_1 /TAXON_ID=236787 /ORGANISM="Florenciella parvula, Strain CCMP2471" /LENGTH=88 /DNA_ID=CAMNT_0007518323 /DNA_START=76 /DNA_END=342 /DNA_ORIENTATION=+
MGGSGQQVAHWVSWGASCRGGAVQSYSREQSLCPRSPQDQDERLARFKRAHGPKCAQAGKLRGGWGLDPPLAPQANCQAQMASPRTKN